ncbi:MAG: GAF domain-containing protein [Thermoplasmata archaeon]|nr:GAF domain-containing protein [Thermoplasmata archaeon]
MTALSRQTTPALLQINSIFRHLDGPAALTEICRYLRREFPHYHWLGIYRLEGSELVLDAWDGDAPTEHVRIPVDKGLCGQAVREGQTVLVSDVRSAPEYLSCFLDTRSEIVVPIRRDGQVIGEIDADGLTVGAYDASDDRFLTEVARKIAPAIGRPSGPAAAPTS